MLFQGFEPFFVNATAGTTVLGVYDPLVEISEVCKKHGLWLHVDGAWGGSVIISQKHKHFIKGIERYEWLHYIGYTFKLSLILQQQPCFLGTCIMADCYR